jgi:hypothetical protein
MSRYHRRQAGAEDYRRQQWLIQQPASVQFRDFRAMPQFAVFFSDGAGFGIEMVQALDAAHAQDIARAQHPTGRLSAVPAELLDGQDRHKLLRAWLRGQG